MSIKINLLQRLSLNHYIGVKDIYSFAPINRSKYDGLNIGNYKNDQNQNCSDIAAVDNRNIESSSDKSVQLKLKQSTQQSAQRSTQHITPNAGHYDHQQEEKSYNNRQNDSSSNRSIKTIAAGDASMKISQEADNLSVTQRLEALENEVRAFKGCDLKESAINTVFADGNPNADIMLIGEAPGATEDKEGVPFCGQSGKLLDNCLASVGLSRSKNVYITNTVFWRPPGNRRPTDNEIEACKPFLEKHIAIIRPKIIIMVGVTAIQALLSMQNPAITSMRGNYFDYQNNLLDAPIKSTPIFHPSYLLRQQYKKKEMWFDLLKIKNIVKF